MALHIMKRFWQTPFIIKYKIISCVIYLHLLYEGQGMEMEPWEHRGSGDKKGERTWASGKADGTAKAWDGIREPHVLVQKLWVCGGWVIIIMWSAYTAGISFALRRFLEMVLGALMRGIIYSGHPGTSWTAYWTLVFELGLNHNLVRQRMAFQADTLSEEELTGGIVCQDLQ